MLLVSEVKELIRNIHFLRGGSPPGSIVVAIDNSGSSTYDFIDSAKTIIKSIAASAPMDDFHILIADTKIGASFVARGDSIPNFSVVQGGGTIFDEPLSYAQKNDASIVVYFTDGQAQLPTVDPECPVIWVLMDSEGDLAAYNKDLEASGLVFAKRNTQKAILPKKPQFSCGDFPD